MDDEAVDAPAYDALHEAEAIVDGAEPLTAHGRTALESASRALALLKAALVAAESTRAPGTPRRSGS
jgi:hypothetical protein